MAVKILIRTTNSPNEHVAVVPITTHGAVSVQAIAPGQTQTILAAYEQLRGAPGLGDLHIVHKGTGKAYPVLEVDGDMTAVLFDPQYRMKFKSKYTPLTESGYRPRWGK